LTDPVLTWNGTAYGRVPNLG